MPKTSPSAVSRLLRDKDFLSGALFIGFGAAFLWFARDLGFGNSRTMGPAYFPTVMAVVLVFIGLVILVTSLWSSSGGIEEFALKGASLVTAGSLLFGVLIRDAGLIVAITALVVVSALGSQNFRFAPILALAIGLSVCCALLFVKLLGLPIPILGEWLGA